MPLKSFSKDRFHVITMISNPVRWKSRYELYQKFAAHMVNLNVNFWTCELQLGDRPFCITDAENPRHLQLRTIDEIWHKENCLRLLIQRLPSDWQTVAWLDADIEFVRKDWVLETLHQLQVYEVVQLFETAIDLSPSGSTMKVHHSFMSKYLQGGCYHPETEYHFWHPGFAWAATRRAIDAMGGGPYDKSILGSGDRNTALALIGKVDLSYNHGISDAYKRDLKDFETECLLLNHDVGCVGGTILHNWHGRKKDRRYADRWEILVDHIYDPDRDIKADWQGVYQLTERKSQLRDAIRGYNRSRREDSIDVD